MPARSGQGANRHYSRRLAAGVDHRPDLSSERSEPSMRLFQCKGAPADKMKKWLSHAQHRSQEHAARDESCLSPIRQREMLLLEGQEGVVTALAERNHTFQTASIARAVAPATC